MIEAEEKWKVLSYEGKKGTSQIVESDTFFFEGERNLDYQYYRFKDYLDNGDFEKELKCKYPARYLAFRTTIDPSEILESCRDVKTFVDRFPRNYISLGLSSEYLGAPSSMFGHVFIVFHNSKDPEIDALTISFNAVVNQREGFFSYIRRGVSGGFKSEFILQHLFVKEYEYLLKEQRFIKYSLIDFNEYEKSMLMFHLYELLDAKFRYYFFNENCAYHLDYILSAATNVPVTSNRIYTLPVDVVKKFQKDKEANSIASPLVLSLRARDRENNYKNTKKITSPNLGGLNYSENDKMFLKDYFLYKRIVEGKRSEEWKSLEATSSGFSKYTKRHPRKNYDSFRTSISYSTNGAVQGNLRPVLLSEDENQIGSLHESFFVLLSPTIEYRKPGGSKLKELDLISMGLRSEYEWISKMSSWDFYLGLNRRFEGEGLIPQFNFGRGLAFSFSERSIFYLGINPDVRFIEDKFKFGAFVRFSTLGYIGSRLKLNITLDSYVLGQRDYYRVKSSLTHYFNETYSIQISTENINNLYNEALITSLIYF